MGFDPSAVNERLAKMWSLTARFGVESHAASLYLDEFVSDRGALTHGLQVLKDELQFAGSDGSDVGDLAACQADFTLPSVVTTLAYTNCGDRIQSGDTRRIYEAAVASRFATLSELGELKSEAFFPTGGGTDDGATLAHVTVAHQLDEMLRKTVYQGNDRSFALACFDLKAHVGRLDEKGVTSFGRTRESPWREPRGACGAIVGALTAFQASNPVHQRIRRHLGDQNMAILSQPGAVAADGVCVVAVVAAAIVAIAGLRETLEALMTELDSRGVGHATASVAVNRPGREDTILYLARGTVFGGVVKLQGFGLDAKRYGARFEDHHGDKALVLTYDGQSYTDAFRVVELGYSTPQARKSTMRLTGPDLSGLDPSDLEGPTE